MNDKPLLFCLPAILCAPLFGAHASGKETPKDDGERTGRPNVLFLLTDDQTFNTIRALGNTEIHTPNMDRLVRRGVAFTQTHVMGGLNGAVSQPSRAMLLTGRGLMDVHRNGGFIPEAEKTFPEVFRENGYTTFATGKWHSDNASFNRSFSTGANIFFGGMHPYGRNNELGHRRPYLHQYDPAGDYNNRNGAWADALPETFSSKLYADAAIGFLEAEASSDDPFLMYVAFTSPHDPRNVLPGYGRKYASAELSMPANFVPQHPSTTATSANATKNCSPRPASRSRCSPSGPTITAWSARWISRSGAFSTPSKRAARPATRSSSSRRTTGFASANTACWASRTCTRRP